ncbi:RagB/SusD family nutrient uptake outer membrane protein [Aestuariibaculum sp. M13]|uniref:RagB/SusD family nutrient uptake outer membrane protein n=1 Tax=Aestuariibaculum sp. M13 TaxID=2967132 RepID=UPI002159E6F5|nr:RagB/SusD family nutrient uptake outer membrane protein [Aestuariibaculum sp. M13]MCR8668953.1 RagB/SusD family nutrient uptake outer membrane protein [Aestuariibaculum sp. M13]
MENQYKYLVIALFIGLLAVSCDNYLDVQPKGVQLLTTVEDYNQWLNSEDVQTSIPNELNDLADNVDDADYTDPPSYDGVRIYAWQLQFSEDLKATPVFWADFYQNIYYFNTVLAGIDDATGGAESEKQNMKAEAYLGRAFEYLYLVNLYGKVYDVNTADQDLAVPFVISNDLEDDVPERSTVQEIYEYIISDIEKALPNLPEDNSTNRFRGSVAAAYSVLARTYLFMGDYEKAAENAQLALDSGANALVDFSTLSGGSEMPDLRTRESAIYARLNKTHRFTAYCDLNFLQSFDTLDLRLNYYYRTSGDYSFTDRGSVRYYSYAYPINRNSMVQINWGPSVAEMRLILAESAARANNLNTAIDQLDLLRSKRFMAEDYEKYDPENPIQEEVLQKVLDERTFEMAFTGMRWFDMRRLAAEGLMPTVYRYDAAGEIVETLAPDSNKYTLQIPIQIMYFNPDWPQNPIDN